MPSPRFIVCRASAGSGKTYTLVRQYIEIAISTPTELTTRFSQILAVTFTNKAVNGMKERILNTLSDICADDEQGLVSDMAAHLQISEQEVVRRCVVVRGAIMHHYSDFSVCTIDSFIQRLVRTFAHDLGLPMKFNVQIDNELMLQASVDNLLALVGTEGEESLTKMICQWASDNMEQGKSHKMDGEIKKIAAEILSEQAPLYLEKLKDVPMSQFLQIYSNLIRENRKIADQFRQAAQIALDARDRAGLVWKDFSDGDRTFSFFNLYAKGDLSKLNDNHKKICDLREKRSFCAAKCPKETRERIEAVTPDILQSFDKITELEQRYRRPYNTRVLLMQKVYSLAVLSKIHELKESYSRENELVHISDFNKCVAQVVVNEPTPFIYERMGSRYHNYLIDEFQDTSRLQWLNMLPLLDEAMTYNFNNTAEVGTCSLIVGDGKQAIYRFRQGDVRQFMMLPMVEDRLHGQSLQHNYKDDPLNCNYRTLKEVVEFNNVFFEWAVRTRISLNGLQADLIPHLYLGAAQTDASKPADLRQSVKSGHDGGYVQLGFYEKDTYSGKVRDIIRHQVDDLGYQYRDIFVLAHEKKTLAKLSDILSQPDEEGRSIPMVSSESFLLSRSRVVQFLHSLLSWLHNPTNRVAAASAVRLYAEVQGMSQADSDALLWRLRDNHFDLIPCFASLQIELDLAHLITMSVYDCVEQLLRLFHLEGRDTGFVATLLNKVAYLSKNQIYDIGGLVKYLEDNMEKISSSTSPEMDAVQLYTVHKAKGLEAPVVIYVIPQSANHSPKIWVNFEGETVQAVCPELPVAMLSPSCDKDKRGETYFDNQIEEEENLKYMDRFNEFYVALTRPKDKLFVACELNKGIECNLLTAFTKEGAYERMRELESGEYACGSDDPFRPADKRVKNRQLQPVKIVRLDTACFPAWEDRIDIARQNQDLFTPIEKDHRRYGIMVHDILSHVITFSDAELELERYSKSHHLSVDDSMEVRQRLMAMMEKEEYRHLFDGRYRVSCEMAMMIDGQRRRPDRVVFASDATWVVEFKTGSQTDALHADHQKQVQRYADALTYLGYPNVQPVLIYL